MTMHSYKVIDIATWSRKNSYNFYKDFDDPYFNFNVNVDVTVLRQMTRNKSISFFIALMHTAIKVANTIDNFRIRTLDDVLVKFDTIHGGSTVLYDDESFGFAYYDYHDQLPVFAKAAEKEIAEVKRIKSFLPSDNKVNLIYFSSMPWISFTSLKHAQHHTINRTIPRITFGKAFASDDRLLMPVNLEVNHAIMDGLHVGRFFERFEEMTATPS